MQMHKCTFGQAVCYSIIWWMIIDFRCVYSKRHRISIREELSLRGSDWQYIFEMEHLPLHPTKPSLIEGRYPTVGHFEGKIFSSWACEPGCYSYKPVFEMNNMPNWYLSFFQNAQLLILSGGFPHLILPPRYCVLCPADFILRERSCSFLYLWASRRYLEGT